MTTTTMPLAMHMANELLSVPAAAITLAVAAAAVGLAAWRARRTLDADRLPLMGVMGAFVFAAQMINFTLPGMPGTSGHLGGGVLLSILLGPAAAIVTMAGILIVQCLMFQDGGLLALGCNIINMGVVPCLAGWAIYRGLLGRAATAAPWRQYLAAWAACTAGVAAGAAFVPAEAGMAGVLRIPVGDFLAVMVGVHLLIGFVEGAITFAVVAYLRRARPAVLGITAGVSRGPLGRGAVAASMLLTAMLLAGVGSWFASAHPDGLEWVYKHHYGSTATVARPQPAVAAVEDWQARWSPMADYSKRAAPLGAVAPAEAARPQAAPGELARVDGWLSLAGIAGTAMTLGLVYLTAVLLRRKKPATA